MTKETLRNAIGKNIKNERKALGITIDELANLMDLTPGFLRSIERGERGATAFSLCKLAEIFGVDVNRLVAGNHDIKKSDEKMRDGKKQKIAALTSRLEDGELDFVLTILKGIETIRGSTPKQTV